MELQLPVAIFLNLLLPVSSKRLLLNATNIDLGLSRQQIEGYAHPLLITGKWYSPVKQGRRKENLVWFRHFILLCAIIHFGIWEQRRFTKGQLFVLR